MFEKPCRRNRFVASMLGNDVTLYPYWGWHGDSRAAETLCPAGHGSPTPAEAGLLVGNDETGDRGNWLIQRLPDSRLLLPAQVWQQNIPLFIMVLREMR